MKRTLHEHILDASDYGLPVESDLRVSFYISKGLPETPTAPEEDAEIIIDTISLDGDEWFCTDLQFENVLNELYLAMSEGSIP